MFSILTGIASQCDHMRCNCSCELGVYVLKTAVPLYFKAVCVMRRGSGLDRVKHLQNLSPDDCTTSSCRGEVVKCSTFREMFNLLFLSIFSSWSLSLKTGDDVIPLQGPPLPLQHCLSVGCFLLLQAPQQVL